MASVRVTFSVRSNSSAVVNRARTPKRVLLRQIDGARRQFEFPFGPKEIRYEGEGIDYISIERPGLVALLEADSTKARTLGFTAVIANPRNGGKSSVEYSLSLLNLMAREDVDLTFTHGVRTLNYRVRITNISTQSVQRDLNGNITQATVDIQLTERPRRNIDPITLNAIRYKPTSNPPNKDTKTDTPATQPANNPGTQPGLDVDPIVSSPAPGGGGGGAVRIQ